MQSDQQQKQGNPNHLEREREARDSAQNDNRVLRVVGGKLVIGIEGKLARRLVTIATHIPTTTPKPPPHTHTYKKDEFVQNGNSCNYECKYIPRFTYILCMASCWPGQIRQQFLCMFAVLAYVI